MRTFLLAVLSLAVALSVSGMKRRAVRSPSPPSGPCHVQGLANFYYSTDGGTSWSTSDEVPTTAGAWDIVSFADEPELLLAVVSKNVYESADAGCSWTLKHTIVEEIHHKIQIARGPSGRAFIWTEEFALRYDRGEVVALTLPERIGAIGIDPGNRDHVRILGVTAGKAYESFNGGSSWTSLGGSAGGFIGAAAFDPLDFDHMVVGVQSKGIMITRDGGKTWTNGAPSTRAVCWLSLVTSQPNVVWATVVTSGAQPFVMLSVDGGTTMTPIGRVEGVPNGVCLPIVANPHDANRAIVPFTQFHQFDAVTSSLSPWSCCGGRMDRITWSPVDPQKVYVMSGAAPATAVTVSEGDDADQR